MRLRLRLLRVILFALLRNNDLTYTGESVLHFTVMPSDCVIKLVGNDRYHSFMDLGRIDLLIRMGGWNTLLSQKLQPFVHTAHIRYRYPLAMFQRFVLRTRLVHSDNRFFLMEHIFECGKKIMATAISKNGLTLQGKIIPTSQIIRFINGEQIPYAETNISVINAFEKLLRTLQGQGCSS